MSLKKSNMVHKLLKKGAFGGKNTVLGQWVFRNWKILCKFVPEN